ncbi:PepSY domain-containing protein [Lachnospiraceae bacterium 42-17]|jgi:uncharacterized membrane protein YkoI|nr:hypothetical protein [Dorea sp.]
MKKCILKILLCTISTGLLAGCGHAADIGKEKAAKIALDDAGLSEANVTRLYISKDNDDGTILYEVNFTAENMEYEYEIQASDGNILSTDYESINTLVTKNQQETSSRKQAKITIEEASRLALDRVPGASGEDIRIELDYDDGLYKYEGDIIFEQKEYEFEIDADTGEFLEWSEARI